MDTNEMLKTGRFLQPIIYSIMVYIISGYNFQTALVFLIMAVCINELFAWAYRRRLKKSNKK